MSITVTHTRFTSKLYEIVLLVFIIYLYLYLSLYLFNFIYFIYYSAIPSYSL